MQAVLNRIDKSSSSLFVKYEKFAAFGHLAEWTGADVEVLPGAVAIGCLRGCHKDTGAINTTKWFANLASFLCTLDVLIGAPASGLQPLAPALLVETRKFRIALAPVW